MSQLADKKENSEIERIIDLDRLGNNGTAVDIVASDGERAALAKRLGFLGLPAFSARVTIDRRIGGQIVVEGRLRGKVVQACVLTLDPVTQELDDAFRLVFKKDLADERDPESGEAGLGAHADSPEPLSGKLLAGGEIGAQKPPLAPAPYPRRPGARLEDVLPRPRGVWR